MKNFLIIGGSSGIGNALVAQLSEQGHQVYATFHTNEQSSTTAIRYKKYDAKTDEFTTDWLPETIDGLAYCPGTINLKPFRRFKREDFLEDFDLQVGGAVSVIQACLPLFKKSELASIVLFSTVAVQKGYNFHSQVSASKGALEGLTKSLAAEFSPKIRVNCIAPSLTDTSLAERLLSSDEKREASAERNPMKRVGQPNDIAKMAAFLLTDQSSWITGQILKVDGGASTMA